jgi:hypothetical protein
VGLQSPANAIRATKWRGLGSVAESGLLPAAVPESSAVGGVYSCFNFRLVSDVPLDALNRAAPDSRGPLVSVRHGPVASDLPGAPASIHGVQSAGSQALLVLPGIGRFLISDGREIVVDPHPDASARTVCLFLLGSALGMLCHQRGLLPLHANAIVSGKAAYAFAGASGAGKSTLAAEFERRGYRLLADDVCMVDLDPDGTAWAWPGIPSLKLWADAADRFGHDCARLERVLDDAAKFHVPAAPAAGSGPAPLRRLYILERAGEGCPPGIRRLIGHEAMAAVMAQTYRGAYLEPMGLGERHFRQCAEMLSAVRVYAATREWGFDCFEREVDRLERHMFEEDPE